MGHSSSSRSAKQIIILGLFLCAQKLALAGGGWWTPRFDLAGANGPINSLVTFNQELYAVGAFTRIAGLDASGIARWDGTKWHAVQPGFNASVFNAVGSEEAMYFGLTTIGPLQPSGLLRWDGTNWMVLEPPPGYRGLAGLPICLHGSDVYAEVFPETQQICALAKWSGTNSSLVAPTRSIFSGSVAELAIAKDRIYACGELDLLTPSAPLNCGELTGSDWLPISGGIEYGLSVYGIASDDENLYVRGTFTLVNSNQADGFAIWDGSQWTIPSSEARGGFAVEGMTANGNNILASEALSSFDPSYQHWTVQQRVVQYSGTNRTVICRGDASPMRVMRRWGDGIYCAGDFRAVGGIGTGNLAVWTGTNWSRVGQGLLQGLDNEVKRVAVAGTNVYVAGVFEHAGEITANHIARWDGNAWHALGDGLDGNILQMATRNDDLYIIGEFSVSSAPAITNMAKWDGTAWHEFGAGLVGTPLALAISEHYVWLARQPTLTNFVISRFDGSEWIDFASGQFGELDSINTMAASDASVLVGGQFRGISGVEVNNLALWQDGTWQSLGGGLTGHREWIPNDYPFTEVRAVLIQGADVYVGGSFTNAGSVAATNVARWDGTQWHALGGGLPTFGSCVFGVCTFPVTSLAIVRGQLFAGGGFRTDGNFGNPVQGLLARWNGTSWENVADGPWTKDASPQPEYGYYPYEPIHVWALAANGDSLFVGGNFATIGTLPSYGFAIWHAGDPAGIRISTGGTNISLRWPRQFQYSILEASESVIEPTWKPVSGVQWPVSDTATNDVQVDLVPSGNKSFYRLRWQ